MTNNGAASGVVVTLTTAVALAPASAFAVDYMSAEQAAKLMFPQADRFESRTLAFDAEQLRRLAAAGVSARSARWQVRMAQRDGATLGYVVVDDVIGKFELITYAVGIGSDGVIRQVKCCRTARATATRFDCPPGASSSSARARRHRCASATTSPTSAAPRSVAAT
jgi:hypothetical protein